MLTDVFFQSHLWVILSELELGASNSHGGSIGWWETRSMEELEVLALAM